MPAGECKLCGEERPLAESHVLPEFFYDGVKDEKGRFISVSSHPRHKPRPMQRGLAEHLLCIPCEGQLSRYETYTAKLLKRADRAAENGPAVIYLEGVDFRLFRLFGLSLIWRMSIAKADFFKAVRLGAHEKRLRDRLIREDPGEAHDYGFAVAKVTGLEKTTAAMIEAPKAIRYETHRAYLLRARGYDWVFFVSNSTAGLRETVPFVGSLPTLVMPFLPDNQRQLFNRIRKAFPQHFPN